MGRLLLVLLGVLSLPPAFSAPFLLVNGRLLTVPVGVCSPMSLSYEDTAPSSTGEVTAPLSPQPYSSRPQFTAAPNSVEFYSDPTCAPSTKSAPIRFPSGTKTTTYGLIIRSEGPLRIRGYVGAYTVPAQIKEWVVVSTGVVWGGFQDVLAISYRYYLHRGLTAPVGYTNWDITGTIQVEHANFMNFEITQLPLSTTSDKTFLFKEILTLGIVSARDVKLVEFVPKKVNPPSTIRCLSNGVGGPCYRLELTYSHDSNSTSVPALPTGFVVVKRGSSGQERKFLHQIGN